jgi:mono/diheme cytochrome c family protein
MMRRVILAAALAAAFSSFAQTAAAQGSAPAASAAPAADAPVPTVAAGRSAYTRTCARCHGINLAVTSSAYFDLRTFPKDEKERFVTSVTNGKRQMPAWGGIVKPHEIEAIWLYIGSVNNW